MLHTGTVAMLFAVMGCNDILGFEQGQPAPAADAGNAADAAGDAGSGGCKPSTGAVDRVEGPLGEHSCSNNVDDDCDGFADDDDADCSYTYRAARASAPPQIDGDCTEYEATMSLVMQRGDTNYGVVRILWDEVGLYFCCWTADTSLDAVATDPDTEHDAAIYRDDSFELLFDTAHDGGAEMTTGDYKFVINVANVTLDRDHGSTSWDGEWISAVSSSGTINNDNDVDQGYVAEGAISWQTLAVPPPEPGTSWGSEFVWNDRDSFEIDDRFTSVWSGRAGDPNIPDGWGELLFLE